MLTVPREIDDKLKPSRSFIISLGASSDLFLQLLASQYKQKIDPSARMADSIPFICMSLGNLYDSGESPKEGDWIAAQYKLFFDSDREEEDAELFMNISPGNGSNSRKRTKITGHIWLIYLNKRKVNSYVIPRAQTNSDNARHHLTFNFGYKQTQK